MQSLDIPLPPFILGFILEGAFETNLRRGLQYSNGNFLDVFSRPIASAFLILAVLSLAYSLYKNHRGARTES